MSRQRTADTHPEVALRSALHRRNVRFRLHRADLPGRPDVVLVRARLAVFVDGCFWHGCPIHYRPPKSNSVWWAEKLQANVERYRRADAALRALGWQSLHVWEHEDVELVAEVIARRWRKTDPRSGV
jgi:DNA mismatch endonuclease (patch repair protein)